MKTKSKRVWSPEQRAAAADRMRRTNEARSAQKVVVEPARSGTPTATVVRERSPEVQAVLDTMSPERRAKLAQIQARTLSSPDAQEALARHEAEKSAGVAVVAEKIADGSVHITPSQPPPLPPIPVVIQPKHPFRFTSGQNGVMISELGPCLCGAAKLTWHAVCLKR